MKKLKTFALAVALTWALCFLASAADVTNTPSFFPAFPLAEMPTPVSAVTNLTVVPKVGRASPRASPGVSPHLDFTTITNGIIWPVPSGAAFVDVTKDTELLLAQFPEGAQLTLAIRNPNNFAVYLAVNPTNTFLLTDKLAGAGRYLLHLQNVKGELWITK